MKKILCVFATITLLLSLCAVSVAAEESVPSKTEEFSAIAYYDYGDNTNTAYQTDSLGTMFAIALKPLDEATAENCWYDFEIEIPGDCISVDIVINYAAKGDNRYFDLTFNDELRHVHCEDTADWAVFYELTETYESIKKGTYTLRLAAPADFDNDSIKTPNIDYITVNMFYEDYETVIDEETKAPETEDTGTEAPETSSLESGFESESTSAPETDSTEESGCGASVTAAAIIVTMASAIGCAIIRKK